MKVQTRRTVARAVPEPQELGRVDGVRQALHGGLLPFGRINTCTAFFRDPFCRRSLSGIFIRGSYTTYLGESNGKRKVSP